MKNEGRSFQLTTDKCRVTLYRGDCIEGMESLEPGSVDVVVTSPPYNVGVGYKSYDDRIPREEYLEWLERWARRLEGVLAREGSLFLNIGSVPRDPWVPFQVARVMGGIFKLQNVIHWIKAISIEGEDAGNYPGIAGDVSVGHYKPVNSPRFLNDCHEYVFHLTKTGSVPLDRLAIGVPYRDKSNVARWKGVKKDLRCRGNVWFVPYKTILSRDRDRPHPATFPVKLARMCMKLHGLDRTRLAMDTFLGIGHAAVAAMELGVDFLGFEIDDSYYEQACRNVRDARDRREVQGELFERGD